MEAQLTGSIVPVAHRATFVKARSALCHDDIATARPLFEPIATALPDNVEVQLYAAWARARLAASLGDRDRAELETLAQQALGTRQSLALPLCVLAHAAVRRGDLRVARRLFRRAAEADPALVDARRGVRMLEQRLVRSRGGRRDESNFGLLGRYALAIGVIMRSIAAVLVQTVS